MISSNIKRLREVDVKKIINMIGLFIITACSMSHYEVKVNSIALSDEELTNYNSCILMPLSDKDEKTIIHKRYVLSLIDLLENNNIKIVDKYNKANCVIFFDYGISEPQAVNQTSIIPNYGVTGVSSSTTSGSVYMQKTGYGNYTGNVSTHTQYTPQYGITGYTPVNQTVFLYIRYLYMEAREIIKDKKEAGDQLWSTMITSVGNSGELNKIMPYMLYVLAENIKTNTQGVQQINFYEDDENIKYYQQLLN